MDQHHITHLLWWERAIYYMKEGVLWPVAYFLCRLHMRDQWGQGKLLSHRKAYSKCQMIDSLVTAEDGLWYFLLLFSASHLDSSPCSTLASLLQKHHFKFAYRVRCVFPWLFAMHNSYSMVLMGSQECGSGLLQAGCLSVVSRILEQKFTTPLYMVWLSRKYSPMQFLSWVMEISVTALLWKRCYD